MFQPNMEAFWDAVVVMIIATPFMFITLTLFTLLALGLSRLPEPKQENEE